MSSPVVISGLGTVSACGTGRTPLGSALAEGRPRWSEIERTAPYHLPEGARLGALVAGSDFAPWLKPAEGRRMSPPSRLAVVAARMALEDAGLGAELLTGAADAEGTGVVLATTYGPSSYTERILRQALLEGPASVSPMLFTEAVANAPAAQVALQLGARGPNLTVTQREAGPAQAVALGARQIASGRYRRVLVGAVEELNPLLHALLDRFGALARSDRGAPELARPFDRRRNGFVAGEGATVLVLETEESASRRNREPIARVAMSASAFDPRASRINWGGCPATLADALSRRLERAGIAPGEIDLIVSGANGSVAGDRLEALVLKRVWRGAALPPLLTPKAITGEFGGSTLAAAMLVCGGAPFGPTPGFEEEDPDLGVHPHDGSALGEPRRLLLSALAVGGAGAWLILERCRDAGGECRQ